MILTANPAGSKLNSGEAVITWAPARPNFIRKMKLQHICYCALLSIAPALLCSGLAAQTPAAAASNNAPAEAPPAQLTRASAPVVALPISVGDEMDVSVYNVPEMTSHQRVNGAGDSYLPLLGKVHTT